MTGYRHHPLNPSPAEEHDLHFVARDWCYFCKRNKTEAASMARILESRK